MPKRKCSFTEDLQKESVFLTKCKLDSEVNCTQCNDTFSVSHGGRSDIKDNGNIVSAIKIKQYHMKQFQKQFLCVIWHCHSR